MISNKTFACGIGSFFALGTAQGEVMKQQDVTKPNVLFIIMDDMCDWARYLGGNNLALTPNLDRLAARGVTFSNAYTAVPLSNPSRTALLTGMPAHVTGVYTNDQEISTFPMVNNSIMMPQHFKVNGYTTICSGKVFHTKPSPTVMANMWDDMTNIDGGYGPFIKNQTLPSNLQKKWQNFETWTGTNFGISTMGKYFNQYTLTGAIVYISGTPNCMLTGTTHGNGTEARAFRLANTGTSSFIEFPRISGVSNITVHVRNANATTDTKIYLNQFEGDAWTTIYEFSVHKSSSYNTTSMDEVITYPVNIPGEVKLRIHGGATFVNIFKVAIEPYSLSTGIDTPGIDSFRSAADLYPSKIAPFKLTGRRLTVTRPSKVSIYNMLGVLVFEKNIESEIILPVSLGCGIFIAKSAQGSQKIVVQQ